MVMTDAVARVRLSTKQQALVLAVIAIIPLELAATTFMTLRHRVSTGLFVVPAAEALLFAGGALWLLQRRYGGFGALGLSGTRALRLLGIAVVVSGLLAKVAGMPHVGQLTKLFAVSELAVLVFVATLLKRKVSTALPPNVVEAARLEIAVWRAAGRMLARRPITLPDDVFTTTRTSQADKLLLGLTLISLVEMPALHLGLHAWLGAGHLTLHLTLGALTIYGLGWLAADHRLMRESGHRLTADGLELSLGLRWRAFIPYAQLREVRVIDGSAPRDRRARRLTPLDAPNLELQLASPVILRSYFGLTRRADRVRLFVDTPAPLAAALQAKIS